MATYKNITGLSDARKVLKQFPDRVQKKVLNAAVRASANELKREVKAAAPVDEGVRSEASEKYGRLKQNIRVIRLRFGVAKTSASYRVDTGKAFWGYFIEYGTRFIAANAWFRSAVDRAYDRSLNKMKEHIAVGVEREAMKLYKGKK